MWSRIPPGQFCDDEFTKPSSLFKRENILLSDDYKAFGIIMSENGVEPYDVSKMPEKQAPKHFKISVSCS